LKEHNISHKKQHRVNRCLFSVKNSRRLFRRLFL